MQDKSKLGTRYQCFQCNTKFYDLTRPEPLCPKCGADQRENPNPDPREALLAKFKGKSAKSRFDETFDEEDVEEEEIDLDEDDVDEDDEEEAGSEGEEED